MALKYNGMSFPTHHQDLLNHSGISSSSGSSRSHRRVCDALQAFLLKDRLNLCALAGGEILGRFLVEIETAISRNPRCPDYADLEVISGATISHFGALALPSYQQHIAELQRSEAFILKQRRMWAEEQLPRSGQAAAEGKGKGKDNKDKGKGKEGNNGRGGGAAAPSQEH